MQTRFLLVTPVLIVAAVALVARGQEPAPAKPGQPSVQATKALRNMPEKAKPALPGEGPEAKTAPRTPADLQRRALAVATFEGGQLTLGEIEDAVERQSPMMRARYADQKNLKDLYEKTLRFSLLAAEATRRGYDKNDAVVQAVKQNAVQALMKADFDDESNAKSIQAEEISKYYQDHISEYVQPAMQRASHVLLATEAEAKALLAEAKKADLRAFRQMARDKSIDEASKLRGGDLRYFDKDGKPRDQPDAVVPAPIVKAVFALKNVGDTAPAPIKIPGGYSIVKLTGQRPALSRKLDEVDETIRTRLWRDRRQKAIEDFVAELRAKNKPETHPELMEAIKLDDPPPSAGPGGPGATGPKHPPMPSTTMPK